MDPIENNPKPQPTGGLKLMTVFIAVLALHVVVIGGFTVWHLIYPSGTDADLAADKTHKNKIVTDGSIGDLPAGDATAADKTAGAGAPTADASAGSTTPDATSGTTPTTDGPAAAATTASTGTPSGPMSAADASGSAPADTSTTPAPATPATTATAAAASAPAPATPVLSEDSSAPTVPPAPASAHITTPELASPAESAGTASPAPTPGNSAATAPAGVAADADAPATAAPPGTPYTVKRGDSLAKIARHHHVGLDALRSTNNLASDRLRIGQQLIIPARAGQVADHAPAAAPTVIAPKVDLPRVGVDTATAPVAQPVQGIDGVAATTVPAHKTHRESKAMASSSRRLYVVVRGDTLSKIARRYHTTAAALMTANNISNPALLSIGQKLNIPPHESRTSTAEEAPIKAEPHRATRTQLANVEQ